MTDWAGDAKNASTDGEFVRDARYISDRIVASIPAGSGPQPMPGTDGRVGELLWPAEPGRYRLMAARACPWAHRAVIVRRLMGLEDAIVLAEELARATDLDGALGAFATRRWERCRMIVENSARLAEIEVTGGDQKEHADIMRSTMIGIAQPI